MDDTESTAARAGVIAARALLPLLLLAWACGDSGTDVEVEYYTLDSGSEEGLALDIVAGQRISISATGEVHTNPGGVVADCDFWTDANGIPDCHYVAGVPEIHGLPFMALIAEWGTDYIFIGTSYTNTFAESGQLTLRVNDWGFGDNEGSFALEVTRS